MHSLAELLLVTATRCGPPRSTSLSSSATRRRAKSCCQHPPAGNCTAVRRWTDTELLSWGCAQFRAGVPVWGISGCVRLPVVAHYLRNARAALLNGMVPTH